MKMKRTATGACIAGLLALLTTGCVTSSNSTTSEIIVPDENLPAELLVPHRRFVRFFGEAVFDNVPEINGLRGKNHGYVTRWPNGRYLIIAGAGRLSNESISRITNAIPTIAKATGLKLKLQPTSHSGDIVISTRSKSSIQKQFHNLVSCYTRVTTRNRYIIKASIFLPSDDTERGDNCIVHELLHAVGVNGHSHTLPSIISYAHEITTLTHWDYITLLMLYRFSQPGYSQASAISLVSTAYADLLKRVDDKLNAITGNLGPALQIVEQDETGIRFNLQDISNEPALSFQGRFDDQPGSSMSRMFFLPKSPYVAEARLDILTSATLSQEETAFFSLHPPSAEAKLKAQSISAQIEAFNFGTTGPVAGKPRIVIVNSAQAACLYFETGPRPVRSKAATSAQLFYRAAGKYCRNGRNISEKEGSRIVSAIGTAAGS